MWWVEVKVTRGRSPKHHGSTSASVRVFGPLPKWDSNRDSQVRVPTFHQRKENILSLLRFGRLLPWEVQKGART